MHVVALPDPDERSVGSASLRRTAGREIRRQKDDSRDHRDESGQCIHLMIAAEARLLRKTS